MKQPIYEIENPSGSRPKILGQMVRDPADLLNVKQPEVSVITICLNMGKFLEDTIRSVANQSYRNFEHIIIDGASTDNTLDILKKYPHLKWISEKDKSAVEAMWKGINRASGKYIMVCYASDGYANQNWIKDCVESLSQNPDVSLVWGFGQSLSEEGIASWVNFPQFHFQQPPQKDKFFSYWLVTGLGLPEPNLCASAEVMRKCYPPATDVFTEYQMLDWAEFTYNFHRLGYLAYCLPVVASFSRFHEGQLGVKITQAGLLRRANGNYLKKWKNFRDELVFKKQPFEFIGRDEKKLGVKFKPADFFKAYAAAKFSKRNLQLKFLYQFGRMKKIPKKLKEKLSSQKV